MELFVTLVVFLSCSFDFAFGLTVTSSKGVEKFIKLDLSSNLQDYINHEEIRLKVLLGNNETKEEVPLVQHRLKEFKSIQQDLVKNKTLASNTLMVTSAKDNHPTSVLAVMRNYLHVWHSKLDNTTAYGPRLEEFLTKKLKMSLPTKDDLYRASAVVSFLQNVYNISKAEVKAGKIKGHQGTPLNAADCYTIGKVSFEIKKLDHAIEWLYMALDSVDLKSPKAARQASFDVIDAIMTISKALYEKEKKDEAIELLRLGTEIEPEDSAIQSMYVSYRSGRKVERVIEQDMELTRKNFFEMCANITKGTTYRNESKSAGRRCRFKAHQSTPYWRYKEEILSNFPYISIFHDFVQGKTIDEFMQVAHNNVYREDKLPGTREKFVWQAKVRLISDFVDRAISDMSLRIAYATGLGVRQRKGRISLGEPLNIIDFGPGGTYSPHRDHVKRYKVGYIGIPNRSRQTTFTVFMDAVKEGGSMVFPELGIGIKPKKGMAVQVNNFKPSAAIESELLTGLCPVLVGRHHVVQKGIFSSGFDQNVLCGRTVFSTHLGVERSKGCVAGPCGAPNSFN